jgi:hypothetical protein
MGAGFFYAGHDDDPRTPEDAFAYGWTYLMPKEVQKMDDASKTTEVPSPMDASDIEALSAASGHTHQDSAVILDELMKAGWVLRPLPPTDAQRRKMARDRKKQFEKFKL